MLPLVYHEDYVTPLPNDHRFPMPKFKLLHDLLRREGVIVPEQLHRPQIVNGAMLQKAHRPQYIDAFCTGSLGERELRKIGLPWSTQLVTRTCTAVGGSYLTARLALEHGLACNLAGGTHHAFPDFGAGFCIFNDLAVASQALLDEGRVQQILIIDLDVHQGDGTAFIFAGEPRVFTFSMHSEKNFPFTKQRSDLDIALPCGIDDDAYLAILQRTLPDLISEVKPDFIFYDAGVDPHREDRLGKLALTTEGLMRREHAVLEACRRAAVPTATVIGGGYTADRRMLAFLHSLVIRAALEQFSLLD